MCEYKNYFWQLRRGWVLKIKKEIRDNSWTKTQKVYPWSRIVKKTRIFWIQNFLHLLRHYLKKIKFYNISTRKSSNINYNFINYFKSYRNFISVSKQNTKNYKDVPINNYDNLNFQSIDNRPLAQKCYAKG